MWKRGMIEKNGRNKTGNKRNNVKKENKIKGIDKMKTTYWKRND